MGHIIFLLVVHPLNNWSHLYIKRSPGCICFSHTDWLYGTIQSKCSSSYCASSGATIDRSGLIRTKYVHQLRSLLSGFSTTFKYSSAVEFRSLSPVIYSARRPILNHLFLKPYFPHIVLAAAKFIFEEFVSIEIVLHLIKILFFLIIFVNF